MKLHRVGSTSDWEKVAAKKRNRWQRLAARTNGILTPGNFFTILGFCLVLVGCILLLTKQYGWSLLAFAVGRSFDLLDGWLAERTGTKSNLGAMLDAGFDKLGGLFTLIALIIAAVVPAIIGISVIAVQVAISVPVALALRKSVSIYPEPSGKIGMALSWVGLLSYIGGAIFDGIPGALLRLVGLVLVLISVGLGIYTTSLYVREYQAIER